MVRLTFFNRDELIKISDSQDRSDHQFDSFESKRFRELSDLLISVKLWFPPSVKAWNVFHSLANREVWIANLSDSDSWPPK